LFKRELGLGQEGSWAVMGRDSGQVVVTSGRYYDGIWIFGGKKSLRFVLCTMRGLQQQNQYPKLIRGKG